MNITPDIKLDFDDVLIRPKRTDTVSRSEVDLVRTYAFRNACVEYTGIPIVAANMDSTGSMIMAKKLTELNMMTALHKHYSVEELIQAFGLQEKFPNHAFYTMGIKNDDFDKLNKILWDVKLKYICMDAANGYQEFFRDQVKRLRDTVGDETVIMAGNICTPEMVQELLTSGAADIIKVGIGPGSVCTTRLKTGIGYPQLSAAIECADAAHGLQGHICLDGGCKYPADVVKAFAAGSDFVMLGGMLAGTNECEGEWEYNVETEIFGVPHHPPIPTKKSLKFYGMSSKEANEKYNGGLKTYRAAEGKCVDIPYKGPAEEVIQEITGGLRSACAYVGVKKLKHLYGATTFVRVTRTHNTIFG
jgi:GMP reductase